MSCCQISRSKTKFLPKRLSHDKIMDPFVSKTINDTGITVFQKAVSFLLF